MELAKPKFEAALLDLAEHGEMRRERGISVEQKLICLNTRQRIFSCWLVKLGQTIAKASPSKDRILS